MAHVFQRCDHEENRKKICAPCGRKIIVSGRKKLEYFAISTSQESWIKKLINQNFDLSNSKYPKSICCNCSKILREHEKNNTTRPFKGMPNYEDICLPKVTRSSDESANSCNCYICLTGRHKGHLKNDLAVGQSLDLSIEITSSNGLYGSSHSSVNKAEKKDNELESKNSNLMTICRTCAQEIGKGKSHSCIKNSKNALAVRAENVQKLINDLPEKQQEQLCTSLLNKKIEEESSSTNHPVSSVSLSTKGRKKTINLSTKAATPVFFSSQKMNDYQLKSGLSDKGIKQLGTFIRSEAGRNSVEPHLSEEVSKRSKLLKEYYSHDIVSFDVEQSKSNKSSKPDVGAASNKKLKSSVKPVKQTRAVIWCNAEKVLREVVDRRGFIDGQYFVKVMADGGKGFFKISMSIIPNDYVFDNEESDDECSAEKKRKVEKWTSVHKLILLAVVPQIKETYENLKVLFDLTRINEISMKFISDFKLILLVNGQQTATATFPCPYCYITLTDLKNYSELECAASESSEEIYSGEDEPSSLQKNKTYGDLRQDYQKFVDLGREIKSAAQCRSTVNTPLFDDADDTKVITKCIIPELHILQGVVNHVFWKGLVPLLGREKALLWPQSLGLVAKNYHGDAFEGNACRKLLKESDKLMDNKICQHIGGPVFIQPFIAVFKAMDKIVHACFGVKRNKSIITDLVNEFRKAFLAIEVTETLKIHVLVSHLEEALDSLEDNQGLGLMSEQAGESIHHEFEKYWNRYKMNYMDDPAYPVRLMAAVVDFSSKHI